MMDRAEFLESPLLGRAGFRHAFFTRNGGVWTQQGDKLVGTGSVGVASQGTSVALSADGNTAIVAVASNIRVAWRLLTRKHPVLRDPVSIPIRIPIPGSNVTS